MKELSDDVTVQVSSRDLSVSNEVYIHESKCRTHLSKLHVAATAAASATKHPDYSLLAGRVYVAALHKYTVKSFSEWVLSNGTGLCCTRSRVARADTQSGVIDGTSFLDAELVHLVRALGPDLDAAIVHARDFDLS